MLFHNKDKKDHTVGDSIRWRMHIPVPPEEVFDTLNTDQGRSSFWAKFAVETEGHIDFRFSNGYTYRSKILERRAPEMISIDYFGGPARFELTPDSDGGTDLLLTHDNVRPEEWIEVHAGWLNVIVSTKGLGCPWCGSS